MPRIIRLEARPSLRLYVEFSDGVSGEYDLSARLNGPMLEPLRDPELFAKVALDDWGAPVWPNGVDLAPDAVHQRLSGKVASRGIV